MNLGIDYVDSRGRIITWYGGTVVKSVWESRHIDCRTFIIVNGQIVDLSINALEQQLQSAKFD